MANVLSLVTLMFALMMRCRAGTMIIEYNPLKWVHDMHIVTVSRHATEDEAYQEALRLLPRGFNRERISLWVRPGTSASHNPTLPQQQLRRLRARRHAAGEKGEIPNG